MAIESGEFDRKSAERIASATRYVETLRRNDPTGAEIRPPEQSFYFGKPDQDIAAGPLTGESVGTGSGQNVISVWRGPAWGAEDEDVGLDIAADYALQDFSAGDYVVVTRYKGKWYVSCLFTPTGTGSL